MAKTYSVINYTSSVWQLANACNCYGGKKDILSIYNCTGSNLVKVYRIWALNEATGAIAGGIALLNIKRTSGIISTGTILNPVAHDTSGSAFPSTVLCTTSGNYTTTAYDSAIQTNLLRRVWYSTDEGAAGGMTNDELQGLVPFNCIWDTGYGDEHVKPITLRENEGISINSPLALISGNFDICAEFTIENI